MKSKKLWTKIDCGVNTTVKGTRKCAQEDFIESLEV